MGAVMVAVSGVICEDGGEFVVVLAVVHVRRDSRRRVGLLLFAPVLLVRQIMPTK